MKIVYLIAILIYSCFSYLQTNRNEDFVLKGIQAAKEQKYELAISYLQFNLEGKNLPDSTRISGEFYLQYAYHKTNNPKFSIEKLDSIVPQYTNCKDSIATVFIRDIAYSLSKSGYYNKALEYGKQATKRIKELKGSQSLEYAYSLDNLAIKYKDCNVLDSALLFVKEAGLIIEKYKGNNNIDYAKNLNIIASVYANDNKYKLAIEYTHKAVDIAKRIKDDYSYAIFLDQLGNYYWNNNEFQLGIKYIEKALKILRNNNLVGRDYAITVSNLAQKYLYIGEFDIAIDNYVESLEHLDDRNCLDYALILYDLSICYYFKGDYKAFCSYSDISLSIMKDIYKCNDWHYFYYQREIVEKILQQEDYIRAKNRIEDILENCVGLPDSELVYYYKQLSVCFSVISYDYHKALTFIKKAIDIANSSYDFENKEDLLSYSGLIHNIADLLMEYGTVENNIDYLRKSEVYAQIALSIRKELLGNSDPLLINSLNLLTCIYHGLNRIDEAIGIGIKLLDTKGLDNDSKANILKNLAYSYSKKEDYETAIKILKEAIKLLEMRTVIDSIIEWTFDLALYYYENNQHEKAVETINNICLFMEKNMSKNSIIDKDERLYSWVYNRLYFILPRWIDKKQTKNYTNLGYDSALKYKNFKSQLTSNVIKSSIHNESNEMFLKYEEKNLLNKKINYLIERGNDKNANLDSLYLRIQNLEKELLEKSVSYASVQYLINITWQDVQKTLCPNDVSIEFVKVENNRYIALLLKSGWKDVVFVPVAISEDISSEEEAIKIWKPIEAYLSPGDNIYFSASGILHQIPIESLPIGDGKIMSDVYNMHRLTSTRELVKEKKEVKYTKAALYGGLNYDMTDNELLVENRTYSKNASEEYFVSRGLLEDSIRGYKWDNLSNTLQEVDYISDLMKKNQITTQIYKGNKGNEESFKALSGHEYNIIHLATHGFFYPDEEAKEKDYFKPMLLNDHYRMYNEVDMSMWRSGLVMSGGNRAWKGDIIPDKVEDGILKAQEIGDLDLRGADLVVLSACNTGQGEVTGEGVFGLQRAFKMAGAQTIVMSLTPVDDQTTMAMMNKFYTNLFSGQSKHDAFYNAQRYIRSIKPDPKYWMGWIMLD